MKMLNVTVVEEHEPQDPMLLKSHDLDNKEGYILRFDNGERVKIKFDNYIKLHRIVSNLTVKNVFEYIKNNKSIEDLGIPDEYHNWFRKIQSCIETQYNTVLRHCKSDFSKYYNTDRRKFAESIRCNQYKSVLFRMMDNKDLRESIFKFITIDDSFELSSFYRDSIQTKRYDNLYKDIKLSDKPIEPNKSNPECIIFDIDGTLALIKCGGRSPFNTLRVNEDLLNDNIYKLLSVLSKSYPIIICTGRSEESYTLTVKWLKDYNINYQAIYFRPCKNRDPDYLIKELMWRKINETYTIVTVFDDRNQVVNHGRKLGLTICQVAEGDF